MPSPRSSARTPAPCCGCAASRWPTAMGGRRGLAQRQPRTGAPGCPRAAGHAETAERAPLARSERAGQESGGSERQRGRGSLRCSPGSARGCPCPEKTPATGWGSKPRAQPPNPTGAPPAGSDGSSARPRATDQRRHPQARRHQPPGRHGADGGTRLHGDADPRRWGAGSRRLPRHGARPQPCHAACRAEGWLAAGSRDRREHAAHGWL